MSQMYDNHTEPKTKENFVQTYLIISGLLLTRIQNTSTQISNPILGDIGFTVFLACTLLYYIIPTLTNTKFLEMNFLAHIFAIIGSTGLALQIASNITPDKIAILTLTILFAALIACTLIPTNYRKHLIIPAVLISLFLLIIQSIS